MDLLQSALLGLGTGAIYAGLAQGLVLAQVGSGVINVGHGAIAMYVAFVYDTLRDSGDYVLPLIGLPARIDLGETVATPVAFVLGLLTAAVLGLLMHVLVFGPLRGRPLLSKIVASVGVMLVLQTIVVLRFGTGNEIVEATLPTGITTLPGLDVTVVSDRLWLAVVVALTGVVLWAGLRYTRTGLALRGAAETEKGAILLGWSPSRLAALGWVLSALSAGSLGMLASSITGVNAVGWVLLVVPALAIAVVGRFEHLGVVTAAGIALGLFESLVARWAVADWFPDWLPFAGAQRALPLVVIVVALMVGGDRLPRRGSVAEPMPASSPAPRHVGRWALVLVPVALLAVGQTTGTLRLHLFVTLASAIVLVSITLLTGFTGQVSLAQAVFAGAAGFVTARLAENSIPFPLSPLLAAVVATVVGMVMAIPALRVRGAQLAVVTMAAGIAIEELVFRNTSVVGGDGAILVPPPSLFGLDLAANRAPDFNRWEFGVLLVVVLTLVSLAASNLRRSGTGRRLLALRANERAAAAVGIDVTRTKLLAFAVSSFIAGIGGAMLAYLRGGVSADSFSVFISLTLLAFAYLGGIGSVTGAIVGAILIPGGLLVGLLGGGSSGSSLGAYVPLIGGIALVATTILAPEGLAGLVRRRRVGTSPQEASA